MGSELHGRGPRQRARRHGRELAPVPVMVISLLLLLLLLYCRWARRGASGGRGEPREPGPKEMKTLDVS